MNTYHTYHGLLNLDTLPRDIKTINWLVCLILIAYIVGTRGYIFDHILYSGNELWNDIPAVKMLAIISPISLIIGWLRITGIRWRYIILLPIFVKILFLLFGFFFYLLLLLTGSSFP